MINIQIYGQLVPFISCGQLLCVGSNNSKHSFNRRRGSQNKSIIPRNSQLRHFALNNFQNKKYEYET